MSTTKNYTQTNNIGRMKVMYAAKFRIKVGNPVYFVYYCCHHYYIDFSTAQFMLMSK